MFHFRSRSHSEGCIYIPDSQRGEVENEPIAKLGCKTDSLHPHAENKMINREEANAAIRQSSLNDDVKMKLLAYVGLLLDEGRLASVNADPDWGHDMIAGIIINKMNLDGRDTWWGATGLK